MHFLAIVGITIEAVQKKDKIDTSLYLVFLRLPPLKKQKNSFSQYLFVFNF